MLNRKDDGSAVLIANPATTEFEVGRTSLLIGLLKSVASNKNQVPGDPSSHSECHTYRFNAASSSENL